MTPRKKPDPRSPSVRPWHPAPYTSDDIYALQNLAKGKAGEHQQKRVLAWIINSACATYEPEFIPDSESETAYAGGKRWVGLQIVKLINMPQAGIDAIKAREGKPVSMPKEGEDRAE
jgi:hypothetical protein